MSSFFLVMATHAHAGLHNVPIIIPARNNPFKLIILVAMILKDATSSFPTPVSLPYEVNIMARLKDWRAKLAREYNLPAYIIMHDKTIIEIIENNPSTIEELGRVKGIGPAKLEKYGNEILRILNE